MLQAMGSQSDMTEQLNNNKQLYQVFGGFLRIFHIKENVICKQEMVSLFPFQYGFPYFIFSYFPLF